MVKHAKKNVTTLKSQGRLSSSKTGQAVRKKTSAAVTCVPAFRSKPTDFIATASTTCSRTQGNPSQTPTATTWKGKTMGRAGKQQKTCSLTM